MSACIYVTWLYDNMLSVNMYTSYFVRLSMKMVYMKMEYFEKKLKLEMKYF